MREFLRFKVLVVKGQLVSCPNVDVLNFGFVGARHGVPLRKLLLLLLVENPTLQFYLCQVSASLKTRHNIDSVL